MHKFQLLGQVIDGVVISGKINLWTHVFWITSNNNTTHTHTHTKQFSACMCICHFILMPDMKYPMRQLLWNSQTMKVFPWIDEETERLCALLKAIWTENGGTRTGAQTTRPDAVLVPGCPPLPSQEPIPPSVGPQSPSHRQALGNNHTDVQLILLFPAKSTNWSDPNIKDWARGASQ